MADRMDTKLRAPSPSNKIDTTGASNFRTEEIRGYLMKKTREGKWQKRWFETNGCFLTYYKLIRMLVCYFLLLQKQGQKLLAALNLPQVGVITLLPEDHTDGSGLFTIELNERVYTIKACSYDEAAFWVDALLWRQAGGMVKKSLEANKQMVGHGASLDQTDSVCSSAASTPTNSMYAEKMGMHHVDMTAANPDNAGKNGAPCAACCVVQ
uniref:PH domain-containing protein n=1 Tax=Hyaloperonospora arabidopsidis (strain Emoy2) TaxID=559515 RepID=M4C4Z0_HYAAE